MSNKPSDYSKFVVCIAKGEDKLYQSLVEVQKNLSMNFRIEQTGLQAGDIMIGRLCDEDSLKEEMAELSPIVANNMNLGVVGMENLKPLWLIERKSITDFCQSFKSAHYANQKSRMMAFRQATKCPCCLVVEGYEETKGISNKVSGIPVSTLEQCFTSIQVRDNFFVQHVENIYYHAEFIGKCVRTLEKYEIWKENYGSNSDNLNKDFTESLKTRRKANLDTMRVFVIQLSSIPDISVNMAEKIAEVYPTWKSLITAFEKDGADCLSEIKVGKNRFGKVKSQKIHQYLFAVEDNKENSGDLNKNLDDDKVVVDVEEKKENGVKSKLVLKKK